MSREKKLSKKQESLYGQELGKIGRAAERGGPVNYVQEKMNDFSQRQMAFNKLKHEPIRVKLAGIGIGLTVAAATNPELGRGVQRVFTGNPIENIKDSLTRQRLLHENMISAYKHQEDLKEFAQRAIAEPPRPGAPQNSIRVRQQHYANEILKADKEMSNKENIYRRAVQTTNEDMALIQTNRIINKAIDKEIKAQVKRLTRPR